MSLHHVEIWVADLESARTEWGWLLGRLGYELAGKWAEGFSWESVDGTYLTLTTSPNTVGTEHDRRRPGLNHMAFRGGTRDKVDRIMIEAQKKRMETALPRPLSPRGRRSPLRRLARKQCRV
ncbi:VOC family protein [Flaviflexus massiliensis]|uniref:VOC family protein n=1 Tax=Flaviflexus massiliensis TaxID=1522309 RepID=UPI000ADBC8AC|nr:VOC family protein [Flaviflexus massiliensis]